MYGPSFVPPLRLGLLGCGGVAHNFCRHLAGSPYGQVRAVASRDPARSHAFAAEHGIARAHPSYESLLLDAQLDAVYLPLPNSLHAEWAIRALEAGKHVLCEKPLALGHGEATAMFDAARRHRMMLLESYPYYFQPQTGVLLDLLHSGELGAVLSVQASIGFSLRKPEGNIRLDPALGGGALLDAGCYPLSLVRLVMGCAPERVLADATWAASGVDLSASATLYFADGRRAQLACAMDTAAHRHATIACSQGVVETDFLNHTAEPGAPNPLDLTPGLLRVRRGTGAGVPFESIACGTGSGFAFAVEALARVVAARDTAAIERAAQASLDIAATLEALVLSARAGRPVRVAHAHPL